MKQKLTFIFILTLVFAANALAQTAPLTAKDYFDRASALVAEGKYQQAATALREAAKLEPNRYEIVSNLGNVLYVMHLFGDATEAFRQAVKIKPEESAAHFDLCRALAAEKKTFLAVAPCQEAIRLDPNREVYYVLLAEVQMANNQSGEALRLLSSVAEQFDQSIAVNGYLGDLYFQDGDLARAVEHYEKVARLKPDLPVVYFKLSDIYLKLSRIDEAITAAQRYVELMPADFAGYRNLGSVLQEIGYVEQSIPAYQKAIQIKPNDGYTYYNLGEAFETLGEREKALEVLQTAYRALPNDFSIAYKYGDTLNYFGRMREAVEPLKKAAALKPNDYHVLTSLGLALFESNDFEEALKVLNAADSLKPNDKVIQMFLGVARSRQQMSAQFGQIKQHAEENPTDVNAAISLADTYRYKNQINEAEAVYQNLIKQNPNDSNLFNWFGIFLSDTGQNEKAAAAFRRAAELKPHHVLYLSISSQLEKLGRNEEALAAIKKSIEIKSMFLETHIVQGKILEKLGRREEALQSYLKAYELAPADPRPNYKLALLYARLGNKEAAIRHFEILKSVSPVEAQSISKVVSAATRKSAVKFLNIKT